MICRDTQDAATKNYDLVVIGGGVYGAMLTLSAAQRGLRVLLLERDDFGAATSHNSLRIIHGGLRYLQTADLKRFRDSVSDRHWFLRNFPQLVRPLSCVMPLYNQGIRRVPVLRLALSINDLLSRGRNQDIPPASHLPSARIVDATELRRVLPTVDTSGLKAGAIWYDAWMPDSQRVLMETLHWACELGATALNYVEALRPAMRGGKLVGVEARDHVANREHLFRANVAVNATGPWSAVLARRFGVRSGVVLHQSIAWNVVLDRPPVSDHAAAVTPRQRGGQTYFLLPWKGKILAGTGHAPWGDSPERPMPSAEQLDVFIERLNSAVPDLRLSRRSILRVFAGLLPAADAMSAQLAVREAVYDHSVDAGIVGLWTVCGVKFTNARSVAKRLLNRIFPNSPPYADTQRSIAPRANAPANAAPVSGYDYEWLPLGDDGWRTALRGVVADEAVQHLDDLVLRRTSLGDNARRALKLSGSLCELFDWTEDRRASEVARLRAAYAWNGGESLASEVGPGGS